MIDFVNVSLTSLSMAIDASSVNATNGIKEKNMKIKKMLFISFMFGLFQFIMPTIGYFIGSIFKDRIIKFLPYIAFSLLLLLAIKSFVEWLNERKEIEGAIEEKKISFWEIIIQAIATSIDAFCIGFVYLSNSVAEAMIIFSIIGVVAFILPFLSVLLARYIAKYIEKYAGLIAALVFVGIGLKILLEGIL